MSMQTPITYATRRDQIAALLNQHKVLHSSGGSADQHEDLLRQQLLAAGASSSDDELPTVIRDVARYIARMLAASSETDEGKPNSSPSADNDSCRTSGNPSPSHYRNGATGGLGAALPGSNPDSPFLFVQSIDGVPIPIHNAGFAFLPENTSERYFGAIPRIKSASSCVDVATPTSPVPAHGTTSTFFPTAPVAVTANAAAAHSPKRSREGIVGGGRETHHGGPANTRRRTSRVTIDGSMAQAATAEPPGRNRSRRNSTSSNANTVGCGGDKVEAQQILTALEELLQANPVYSGNAFVRSLLHVFTKLAQ